MNTSIVFITDPEFKVDFACFSKPQAPDKIQSIAHNSLSFMTNCEKTHGFSRGMKASFSCCLIFNN